MKKVLVIGPQNKPKSLAEILAENSHEIKIVDFGLKNRNMEYLKEFELPKAEYFRAMRAKHDLSAKQVSKEVGISHQTLLNLEKGNYGISYQTVIKLVEFYKGLNDGNKEI